MAKSPPKWAQDLMIDACLFLGIDDVPELIWRHTKRWGSSGACQGKKRVFINGGKDRTDAKLILLHEISHAVSPTEAKDCVSKTMFFATTGKPFEYKRYQCHTDQFWDTCWKLYRWAKLPIRYCQQREANYRQGSIAAYHRSLKHG